MKHALRSLTILAIMLTLFVPILAQDSTTTAEATAAATIEAAPVSVISADGGGTTINLNSDAPSSSADASPWGIILTVAAGFVGVIVTLSFGLQSVGNRAKTAADNPLEVAVLEKAYDSIPSSVVQLLIDPLKQSLERSDKALQNAVLLISRISDGVPEASKPKSPSSDPNEFLSTNTNDVFGRESQAPHDPTPPATHG